MASKKRAGPTGAAVSTPKRVREVSANSGASSPAAATPSPPARKGRKYHGDEDKDMAALLLAISKCTSSANGYLHFEPPVYAPNNREKNGCRAVVYSCKSPTCQFTLEIAVWEAPVRQLWKHHVSCGQKTERVQTAIGAAPAFQGVGKLSADEVTQEFALWCAANGRPFAITDDTHLPRLLNSVARAHRPSPHTISRAVADLAAFCRDEMYGLLQRAEGKISIVTDAWTAGNGSEVMSVFAYFHIREEGSRQLKHVVVPIDFIPLLEPHSGAYLAYVLNRCLDRYDIADKVISITTDDASNCKAMIERMGSAAGGRAKWVRCWAHILNILVTTLFAFFDDTAKPEKGDPAAPVDDEVTQAERQRVLEEEDSEGASEEEDKEDEPAARSITQRRLQQEDGEQDRQRRSARFARHFETTEAEIDAIEAEVSGASSSVEDVEVEGFDEREEGGDDAYTRNVVRFTLRKCSKFAERAQYSPGVAKALVSLSLAANPPPPGPHTIRSAPRHRWNAKGLQMRRIYDHREQIKIIQADKKYKIKPQNRFTAKDFALIKDLLNVLEPFDEMTRLLSEEGLKLLDLIVLLVDRLTEHFEGFLSNKDTTPALHNALVTVIRKLFWYYGSIDDCPLYAASIFLHPALGLRYMRNRKWPQEWQDNAVASVQALYNTEYRGDAEEARRKAEQRWKKAGQQQKPTHTLLANLSDGEEDELDLDDLIKNFASTRRVSHLHDDGGRRSGLEWWETQYEARESWDGLTRMALDVFSVPASSVDVERGFSFGGFTCAIKCRSMSTKTLISCMALAAADKQGLVKAGMLASGRKKRREEKKGKQAEVLEMDDSDDD